MTPEDIQENYDGTVYKKKVKDGGEEVSHVVTKDINGVEITWNKEDSNILKNRFDVSMEEEVGKILKD